MNVAELKKLLDKFPDDAIVMTALGNLFNTEIKLKPCPLYRIKWSNGTETSWQVNKTGCKVIGEAKGLIIG